VRRVPEKRAALAQIEADMSTHVSTHVPTNSEQRWLKVAEVAHLLRVSKMTVYRLITSGELRSARVGRSYRLTEEDVNAYLKRGNS
jgi:excisionase family DNA binding protein